MRYEARLPGCSLTSLWCVSEGKARTQEENTGGIESESGHKCVCAHDTVRKEWKEDEGGQFMQWNEEQNKRFKHVWERKGFS